MGPELRLTAGGLRLELSPSVGGAISAFDWVDENGSRPILRKCHSPLEKVIDAACFPLVPFANRIRGGRFAFGGREVRLAPNMAGDPSPLHGQGWLNAWVVEEADKRQGVLSFRHEAGEWPWAYEARQEFELDERGFLVRLTCRNLSQEPMPCGLGQHPYFNCDSETRLDTSVTHAWTIDGQVLPVGKVPAEGRFDLRNREICGQDLDHGFGGWAGIATIYEGGTALGQIDIRSPDARFLQVYSPPQGGFFAAEPVGHANAALNEPEEKWPELGIRILEPGETMSFEMRIDVIPG
jgi:aldose 1-epimerase